MQFDARKNKPLFITNFEFREYCFFTQIEESNKKHVEIKILKDEVECYVQKVREIENNYISETNENASNNIEKN